MHLISQYRAGSTKGWQSPGASAFIQVVPPVIPKPAMPFHVHEDARDRCRPSIWHRSLANLYAAVPEHLQDGPARQVITHKTCPNSLAAQLCDRDCGSGSIPATTPPRAPSNVLAFSRRQCGYFHHMVQHDRTHAEHTSLTTSLAHRSTGPLALPEQCRLALILREALPKVFATVATTLQYMK